MAIAAALVLAVAAPLARATGPSAYVYATDSNPKLPQYSADASGLLTPLVPALAPAVATSTGVAASPDRRTLYVVDQPTNDVSQYAIGDGGTLSQKSPATVATGAGPFGIAVAPDGGHVYVTNQTAGTISVFAVGSDGALVPGATAVASGTGTVAIALSPDGASAYAANAGAGTISQYDVDPASGALTPKGTPTVAAGSVPFAIAVSADGQSVYATNRTATGLVRQYTVGAGGELTPKAMPTVAAGSRPAGIVATDGTVYVSNFGSDTVGRYTADADGALTQATPDVAAPHSPFGMALSPDGRSLYVAGFGDGTVGQYDIGADGALTAKTPASVTADVRPLAIATVRAPDKDAPTVDLRTPPDGAEYGINTRVEANYSCADEGSSGLASCTGDVADGDAIDTSTAGTHQFTVVARDGDGNETTVTHTYTVSARFDFVGFVGPVQNGSVVRAGSAVPIAFSLGGFRGLDVLADGSPSSARVDCDESEEPPVTYPARSEDGLQFDDATSTYTFAWETRSWWVGTCRAFVLKLRDGTVAQIVVRFSPHYYWYRWHRHW